MRKTLTLALFAALVLPFFAACGGGGPAGKLIDHMDKVVGLLEKNKEDATKANEAIKGYMADHKAEMESLATDMQKKVAEVQASLKEKMEKASTPAEKMEIAKEAMEKMGLDEATMKRGQELDTRVKKVLEENPTLKENTELMAQLDGVEGMMKGN